MKAPQTIKRVSRSVGALLSRAKLLTPKSTRSAQFGLNDEPLNEACEEIGRDEELDKLEKALSSHTLSETVGSNSFKGESDYLKILQSGSSTLTDDMVGDLVEKELNCNPCKSNDQHSSELSVSTLGQVSCDDGFAEDDQPTSQSRDLTTDREIITKEVREPSVKSIKSVCFDQSEEASTRDQHPLPEDNQWDSQLNISPANSNELNVGTSSSMESSGGESPRLVMPPIQSGKKTITPHFDRLTPETPNSSSSSTRSNEFVKKTQVIITAEPTVEKTETSTSDSMVATEHEPDTGSVLENGNELTVSGSTETHESPKSECNTEAKSEATDTSAHSMATTEIETSKQDLPMEDAEELTATEISVASVEPGIEGGTKQVAFQSQDDMSGSDTPPTTSNPMFFDNFGSIVDRLCCPQTTSNDEKTSAIAQTMEEATSYNEEKELVDPSVASSALSAVSDTSSKDLPQAGLSTRQKPDLCVITKPDTFDEVADAALLVHDMANKSGSFDTVQCEKIDKALTLLKQKAEELGIEESDLLAAMQSMDDSDILSPETTATE